MKLSEETCRIGFEQLGDVPFGSIMDMVKIAPDLLRLGGLRSVYNKIAQYVKDERLRVAFSFHPLLIGGNPFTASALYTLIPFLERRWGVHWAMGGTGAVVRGLVTLIEGQGSAMRYNAEVAQITTAGGKATGVRLASGETITADIVVSNADSAFTYTKLLSETRRLRWSDFRLRHSRYSMGLFVWYFGTNRRYDDVYHHTIMLGPRYRGLLDDIFSRKVLADDFSLYLHRPSATDPSVAPPGCDAFYVLSPVPNLLGATDWRTEAETLPAEDRRPPFGNRAAGPGKSRRHLETAYPNRFPRSAAGHPWLRLRTGTGAAAKRLVPSAQQERGYRGAVSRRRRHPSGCGRAGCSVFRQSP